MIDPVESISIISRLREAMIGVYGDWYFKCVKEDPESYNKYSIVVQSSVARMILMGMYREFVKSEEEFLPIEELDLEIKNKYWAISRKWHSNIEIRKEACKAMYVMDCITGNF